MTVDRCSWPDCSSVTWMDGTILSWATKKPIKVVLDVDRISKAIVLLRPIY